MADISCVKFRPPGLCGVHIIDSTGVIHKTGRAKISSSRTTARPSRRAGSVGISPYLQGAGNQLYILSNRK